MALPRMQLFPDHPGGVVTVADLIRDNHCTAACIAAITEPSRCKCLCAGRFHSLVGNAHIDALVEARRGGLQHLTDLEVLTS